MKKILKMSFVFVAVLFLGSFYINTVFAEGEITPITINLKIRSGATVFFDSLVELLPTGTTEINGHTLDARSVLSTLNKADLGDENWNISDLQYFESFGSFLLNCITSSVGNDCYDWQYAVNGETPSKGMDKEILIGGETVYVYFSPQNRITLSADTMTTSDSLLVTAEKYSFEDNTWTPATDITLGVTQPDPASSFNPPIEIMTSLTDTIGQATFTSIPVGLYDVGIRDNFGYYFPTKPLTVTTPPPSGGGGGGGSSTPEPEFSATDAINYLKSVQSADGSFGDSDMYTDWVAIAYGAGKVTDSSRDSILAYLSSNNSISSLLTDNERRAMALLSLGKNPYAWEEVNYIEAIIKEFDGTQFGDVDLVNDDIFALIPLAKTGYTEDDDTIIKTVAFIISQQQGNGSWEDSVDVTAAAIQALNSFDSVAGVSEALLKATTYLETSQNSDGGWGNISATSWAMQAENALNASWTKNGKSGIDYLAEQQTNADNDGAMLPPSETLENTIWATSYAIPAGLGKTWNDIMKSFSKPKDDSGSSRHSTKDTDEETTPTTDTETPETVSLDAQINPAIVEVSPVLRIETPVPKIKKPIATSQPTITETSETTSGLLAATAVNALQSTNSNIPQNIPLFLGIVSSIALLFALLKFFNVF